MPQGRTRTLLTLTLVLVAAGLLLLNVGGYLEPVKSLVLRPMGAIQGWLATRAAAVRTLLTSPADVLTLRSENERLLAEISQLQQDNIALREEAAEAAVLRALLGYARSRPESHYLAANVIGRDVSPFIRSIWIGRGSDAGLMRGMPVVTERGLVGRVAEVLATVARVQLITDPVAVVNVKLQTSRADGVLRAQVNGELWVEQIEQVAAVVPDELVLTSGLGGAYPPEVPVGQVLTVRKRDFELFQQAVIQPSVDFESLAIVLVITNFEPLILEPEVP
ncbi:MAG TPA: rod shape-determining protein MreC [Anaerolineales bacterium]|nr:rod shape-determining protein MreC [Anaerolineales bacterium]